GCSGRKGNQAACPVPRHGNRTDARLGALLAPAVELLDIQAIAEGLYELHFAMPDGISKSLQLPQRFLHRAMISTSRLASFRTLLRTIIRIQRSGMACDKPRESLANAGVIFALCSRPIFLHEDVVIEH